MFRLFNRILTSSNHQSNMALLLTVLQAVGLPTPSHSTFTYTLARKHLDTFPEMWCMRHRATSKHKAGSRGPVAGQSSPVQALPPAPAWRLGLLARLHAGQAALAGPAQAAAAALARRDARLAARRVAAGAAARAGHCQAGQARALDPAAQAQRTRRLAAMRPCRA